MITSELVQLPLRQQSKENMEKCIQGEQAASKQVFI